MKEEEGLGVAVSDIPISLELFNDLRKKAAGGLRPEEYRRLAEEGLTNMEKKPSTNGEDPDFDAEMAALTNRLVVEMNTSEHEQRTPSDASSPGVPEELQISPEILERIAGCLTRSGSTPSNFSEDEVRPMMTPEEYDQLMLGKHWRAEGRKLLEPNNNEDTSEPSRKPSSRPGPRV